MNHIGTLIESRRGQLGLSRLQLASRLGVSSQTVLNLERDPTYNLGLGLLRRLEGALNVTFNLTMKEGTMSETIQMGNDEFILYIRKNYKDCVTCNVDLGKKIWTWIREQDETAVKVGTEEAVPCIWGDSAKNIGENKLPVWATQFEFKRSLLPSIYNLLDSLGNV